MKQRSSPGAQENAGAFEEEALTRARRDLVRARHERDALAETVRLDQARETMLVNELQHRVRNMLAVIRSLLRRTLEASPAPDEFASHFEGRVDAIARYQLGRVPGQSRAIDLEDIVRDELLATRCLDTPACSIAGPAVDIEDEAIEPITLAIHELATNAFKFGALKGGSGKIDIGWSLSDDAGGTCLHFRWAETGVPIIAAKPHPEGFGRQFIEEALPYQLGARTSFTLRPGGVVCTIVVPVRRADDPSAPYPAARSRVQGTHWRDDR